MHKDLKSIDVVFENCEVVSVPGDNVELFDVTLGNRWLWHNWSCSKEKRPYLTGHTDAKSVWLCAKLKGLSDEDKKYLRTRKDIAFLDILYEDGTNEYVRVPEPMYFCCWFRNPYQINYTEDEGDVNKEAVSIRIEPHWSLLGIYQWFKDRWIQIKHDFPRGLLIMIDGYWGSFKRHFRCRH